MKPHPLSFDIISTLPSSILETILCLLPIDEAARTSILSKEWRYIWTKIPKLEFREYLFEESTRDGNQVSLYGETITSERKRMGERIKLFYIIYQVLLMRQGPIDEFALSVEVDKACVEIDLIVSYLSRNNTVKKLELDLWEHKGLKYMVPISVFSWHHLTRLHLQDCDLRIPPTFSGFHSLQSLYLKCVSISTKSLLHLISNCPLLKVFNLHIDVENLAPVSPIIELVKCLPLIEDLRISSCSIEHFVMDSVSQELPTSLIHLKYFSMDFTCFGHDKGLPFLALLIRCSPNLETMELQIESDYVHEKVDSRILEKYSDIWLEHLTDLEICGFSNMRFELEFLKFILSKSPKLKRVYLPDVRALKKKKKTSKMLRFLLCSPPPASPAVKIIVN